MSEDDVFYTIQIRRDTSENWQTENPVLNLAELGLDVDKVRLKAGDGHNTWEDLPFVNFIDTVQLLALIRLFANLNSSNVIFDVVQTRDDIYIKCTNPINGDLVFVLDENKFYRYREDLNEWTELTSSETGSDVTRDVVISICNNILGSRIVSEITNSEELIPSAGQIYRLNEDIIERSESQNTKNEWFEKNILHIHNRNEILTDLYVDESSSDATGDGTLSNPFRTIHAAIDRIPITSNRLTRTVNIHLLSNITITANQFVIPDIIGVNKLCILADSEKSITFSNTNENGFEIDMNSAPIVFKNISFNFGENRFNLFLNLDVKAIFDNCKFTSTFSNDAIIGTDKMCRLILDTCELNSNGGVSCIYLNCSNGNIINTTMSGSDYGISLRSSLCITENNVYNTFINYMHQLDLSEVI